MSHMAQFQMKGSVPKRADTSGTCGQADRDGMSREAPGNSDKRVSGKCHGADA